MRVNSNVRRRITPMGPEPLILPLAILAVLLLLGGLVAAVLTKSVVWRWTFGFILLAGVALFLHQYTVNRTLIQTVTLTLMSLGYLVFVGLLVAVVLLAVLLPLRPLVARIAARFRSQPTERE
jgi:hypothetical protein